MAILDLTWQRIYESLPMIQNCNHQLAAIGYPDFLVSQALLESQYGSVNHLPMDSKAKIIRQHHSRADDFPVYDMLEILQQHHGFECTVLDLHRHRKIEQHYDANQPLDPMYHRRFSYIVDNNILEHCFNVAQAFRNMCDMTAMGGIVCTINPVYWFNHGYYSINPIMLYDGFVFNGFKIISQELMGFDGRRVSPTGNHHKVSNLVVAQRVEDRPFQWPIQTHKGQHIKL